MRLLAGFYWLIAWYVSQHISRGCDSLSSIIVYIKTLWLGVRHFWVEIYFLSLSWPSLITTKPIPNLILIVYFPFPSRYVNDSFQLVLNNPTLRVSLIIMRPESTTKLTRGTFSSELFNSSAQHQSAWSARLLIKPVRGPSSRDFQLPNLAVLNWHIDLQEVALPHGRDLCLFGPAQLSTNLWPSTNRVVVELVWTFDELLGWIVSSMF